MFGQLKENILHNLDLAKDTPKLLKTKFAVFTKTLKESKDLKQFYNIYDIVESAQFANEAIAKEFLDECLIVLGSLNKTEVDKLKDLAEGVNVKTSPKAQALDQLLFNENLNLREKYDQKMLLIKHLTKITEKKVDYKEMVQSLDKKVNSQVSKMTNEQREALDLFIENDESKLNTYYKTLVESTIDSLENKILATESVEENRTLIQVRKKLKLMESEKPSIDNVDTIIELKLTLDAKDSTN